MKSKILLGIALTSISMAVLANDGVKVISEKFTSTPGFNAGFYSYTSKKNTSPLTTQAKVSVTGKNGKVREYIKVDSNHSVEIVNRDTYVNRYTYKYTLRCDEMSADYEKTIELKPGESFRDSSYSYGTVQKLDPGSYRIEAKTRIDGRESHAVQDWSYLTVTR